MAGGSNQPADLSWESCSGLIKEPSETDRRAVRDDPDLKGDAYEGQWVISEAIAYLVAPNGQVTVVGSTPDIIGA